MPTPAGEPAGDKTIEGNAWNCGGRCGGRLRVCMWYNQEAIFSNGCKDIATIDIINNTSEIWERGDRRALFIHSQCPI